MFLVGGTRSFLLAGFVLLSGCATVPKDAGFSDVQRAVAAQTGHQIHWNQGTAADQQVSGAIERALHRQLTVHDAVEIALLNNQDLQATYEELGVSQAEVVEAGLLSNPTLSADVRFPSLPALPYEIDVMQDFLELFVLPLRKHAAGAAFEAAKQRVTNEVLGKASDTTTAYYRVQASEQLVDLDRGIVRAAEASYDAARQLHDVGNMNDLNLANQRAIFEQAKLDLARTQRDAMDAREELNGLMGVWGTDTDWTISPKLPDVPPAEVPLAGLESLALSNRPDLAAAKRDVEASVEALKISRYAALEGSSVGVDAEKDTDGAFTVGPAIQMPLPIFNQGQAGTAAAEARLRQNQDRYNALAVRVRTGVRRDYEKMLAARDMAEDYSRVVIPLSHQIEQQTQLQYNGMFVGVFDLLQARQSEINAGREYVQTLQDYWAARTELQRDVGGRLLSKPAATMPATTVYSQGEQP